MNLTCCSPSSEDVSVRVWVTFTDAGGYWPWSMTPAGWSEAVRPDKCNIPLPLISAAWAVISGAWHELFEEEDKSPRFVKGVYIVWTIADYWSSFCCCTSWNQVLLVVMAPWDCSWKGGTHRCGLNRKREPTLFGSLKILWEKRNGLFPHVRRESDDAAWMREGDEWDVI